MRGLLRHPFVKRLLSLQLEIDDYVVAGSGPLLARGLITKVSDLDVVARGAAWKSVTQSIKPKPAPFGSVNHVTMFDGALEILDGWFPEVWSVDELIRSADSIDGINFVNLSIVRRSKKILGRQIDKQHITIIDQYLADGGA